MYNESTTIVDVIATTGGYALSIKAGDLYIAYEVVRRHIDEDGARHFAQLTESKLTADGYSFTFDTGDVFTCAAADEYPTAEHISDTPSSSSGTGGGVLVVHESDNDLGGYTLDKTWQEIFDADYPIIVIEGTDLKDYLPIKAVYMVEQVYCVESSDNYTYSTTSADGYPQKEDGK